MNIQKLSDVLADETGISKAKAREGVHAIFDAIARDLAAGVPTGISNFGTLAPVERPERIARNPQTGEAMTVPARTAVRFLVSDRLRDGVRDGDTTISIRKLPQGGGR